MSLRSKKIFGATSIFLLAEQCLRGHKAKVWRVMAQSLKTPGFVSIRDHLSYRYVGLFLKSCGYRTN